MIVYSFNHYSGRSEQININYDLDTNVITANKIGGGIPDISYPAYEPPINDGDLIYQQQYNGNTVKLFWKSVYPFAYSNVNVNPDPTTAVIDIDSIPVTHPSTPSINDGTATVNVSGGTPPYSYSLDGVNYQDSNVFDTLAAGDYTIFIQSEVDPVTTGAFTIPPTPEDPPVISPSVKDVIALSGAEINIQNAYKRVEVMSEFGKVPALLYNGDFETWDGHNFNFWTRYGGLDFSRVQRTVTNANGIQVPIVNYAIQFNQMSNAGKWIESSPIQVQKGDTLKLQYSVGKTDTTVRVESLGSRGENSQRSTKTTTTYYGCQIRIKLGNYYLRNIDYGNTYEWVTGLSTVINLIDNKDGDLNTFKFSFDIPACPDPRVSETDVNPKGLVIQLYGFRKIQAVKIATPTETVSLDYTNLTDYTPQMMDDISISKNSQSDDNDVIGLLSVSENLGYYTEKPDQIKILFGDYFHSSLGTSQLGNIYAIKVAGNYSTGWYEYGTTNSPIAFGLALAKSILRAYQKPFRFWTGEMKLKPLSPAFSYLNTFNFQVPGQPKFNNKVFALLGGDFDLKYNTVSNVKLAEMFDRPGKSIDITVPSYPGSTPPVFTQDPNGDSNNSNGIFTDEFTIEFT